MKIDIKIIDARAIDKSNRHHNSSFHEVKFEANATAQQYAKQHAFKLTSDVAANGPEFIQASFKSNVDELFAAVQAKSVEIWKDELSKKDAKLTDLTFKVSGDDTIKAAIAEAIQFFVSTPRPEKG